MADLQEQLQSILGDPQAMRQISAIAQALTGGAAPSPEPEAQDVEFIPVEDTEPGFGAVGEGDAPAADSSAQGETPDLGALLGMLGGPDMDPRLIQIAMRVFSEYSAQDDAKAALLSALKPFLRAERLEKLEKAEKIARLSRVVRVAVQLLKEEGTGDV